MLTAAAASVGGRTSALSADAKARVNMRAGRLCFGASALTGSLRSELVAADRPMGRRRRKMSPERPLADDCLKLWMH